MNSILACVLIVHLLYNALNASNASSLSKTLNNEFQNENSDENAADDYNDEDSYNGYFAGDSIVLSGTFDRLHNGHKLFLTEAIHRAKKRVVVGVHDGNAIQSKILHELILPIETRVKEVRNFIETINTSLEYEVVPIEVPFGAAINDSNLDVIIVSSRTLSEGVKVNKIREANGAPQLQILCIDLIEMETDADGHRNRVSSSQNRMKLLGKRLKEPIPKPHLPHYPYIIGLIGGIAAGKSHICRHFDRLGAIIINGDKLAHEMYEPATECYANVVAHFGNDILTKDNHIDRKKLGAIVFADKTKLNELNQIVWPAALDEVQRRIDVIRKEKSHNVVVIEAAVLLQAGWQHEMHELWTVIIPRELAIQRVIKRDNSTEELAKRRIDSQPSNESMVNEATVVFATQWNREFSKQQAEEAWNELQEHLMKLDN